MSSGKATSRRGRKRKHPEGVTNCDVCSEEFQNRAELYGHMSTNHPETPMVKLEPLEMEVEEDDDDHLPMMEPEVNISEEEEEGEGGNDAEEISEEPKATGETTDDAESNGQELASKNVKTEPRQEEDPLAV